MTRPYTDPTTGEWVGEHETRVGDQITRQTEWFSTESEARRFARTDTREITTAPDGPPISHA